MIRHMNNLIQIGKLTYDSGAILDEKGQPMGTIAYIDGEASFLPNRNYLIFTTANLQNIGALLSVLRGRI